MTIELRPFGVRCNIACHYCYQEPVRASGNFPHAYDMAAMKAGLEREGGPFSLFGGEPLLVPRADLEELFRWGRARYGYNAIQTNGVLIGDDHIRLFKQYAVHVGVSIDGPGALNDLRFTSSLEKTRHATARTEAAIHRLCREGIPPALIVTLHRANATAETLPQLARWLVDLDGTGITQVRLHILESESPDIERRYALSTAENVDAFLFLARLETTLSAIRFDLFADMRRMLLGDDARSDCVWHPCDPYTTPAVRGIDGNGQSTNCGRTNKDGVDFRKADAHGFERVLALYHTPEAFQGCKGCRFFLMCKGQCPGTSAHGDWRNRSAHCEVWKALYGHFERQLRAEGLHPISVNPVRYLLERQMLAGWERGQHGTMAAFLGELQGRADDYAGTWAALRQAAANPDGAHS